jgi:hypothetical protein
MEEEFIRKLGFKDPCLVSEPFPKALLDIYN